MIVTTTPTVEGYPVTQYLRMLMVTASGTAVRFSTPR